MRNGGNVNLQDRGSGNLRVLHTCTQASTDEFLDDSVVENMNPAIRSKMPHRVVLGAGSRQKDRKRIREFGHGRGPRMKKKKTSQLSSGH